MSNSLRIALPLNSKRAWETPACVNVDSDEARGGMHGGLNESYNNGTGFMFFCHDAHASYNYTHGGTHFMSSMCPAPTVS